MALERLSMPLAASCPLPDGLPIYWHDGQELRRRHSGEQEGNNYLRASSSRSRVSIGARQSVVRLVGNEVEKVSTQFRPAMFRQTRFDGKADKTVVGK